MANTSEFSVGLMHELAVTLAKVGFQPKDLGDIAKNENLCKQLLALKRGELATQVVEHWVDLDADPMLPNNDWKVEEHHKGGRVKLERQGDELYIDGKKFTFWFSSKQKGDKSIEGHKLRKELVKKSTINANVIDYLLAHPELIPDSWKYDEQGRTRYIFFWSTIYRYSDGSLCVRCLYWCGGEWRWRCYWLGNDFDDQCPAALLEQPLAD